MSFIPCKGDAQHVASPSRGVSPRPVMERTRLFKSQLDSIIKDQDKDRSRGGSPPSASPSPRIKEEVKDASVKCEPNQSARQLDFDLQDREEPSGAEGDDSEDLQETPVVKREGFTETIYVAVTTCKQLVPEPSPNSPERLSDVFKFKEEQGEEPVHEHTPHSSEYHSSGNDESDHAALAEVIMKPKKQEAIKNAKGEQYSSKPVKNELSESQETKSKNLKISSHKKIKSSRRKHKHNKSTKHAKSRSPSPTKHRSEDSLKRVTQNSQSPTTHHERDSCKRKIKHSRNSASPSNHPTSDSSKRKSICSSGSKDDRHEKREDERSRSHRSESPQGQTTTPENLGHVETYQSFNEETASILNYPFVPHYKQKSIQLLGYDPDLLNPDHCHQTGNSTPIRSSDHCKSTHRKIAWQQLSALKPLSKISSSEIYVDVAVSSESDDEIIDHEIFTVPKQDKMGSCSSLSSRSDSGHSKLSFAPDYSPSAELSSPCVSSRPRTVYHMQANPDSIYPSYSSPSSYLASGHSSPLQFPPNFVTTPPPPPPPMYGGVFPWSSNVEISSTSPLSRPQLPSPQPPLLFSQCVDKRFQRLQNLHNPPKPNFMGYQLIGDSMLLRFSQQILGESSNFAESLRFLGYCVSGQKIGELLKRLKSGFYHIGKKVVLMIGTNDLLRSTHVDQMREELRRVVNHLRTVAEEVVVLTLPPVPRLEHLTCHWLRLNTYNNYIKQLGVEDSGISVFDLSPLYTLTQEEIEEEEMLVQFNAGPSVCRGCLTCTEDDDDDDDFGWDSSQSDEDDIDETALLTHVLISTSPITVVDSGHMFADKRIRKCRLDCFEMRFSESSRKDMIHLNLRGLKVVKEELIKIL